MSNNSEERELAEAKADVCDWQNRWGRITRELDIPWESSGGKALDAIRELKRYRVWYERLRCTIWSGGAGTLQELNDIEGERQEIECSRPPASNQEEKPNA